MIFVSLIFLGPMSIEIDLNSFERNQVQELNPETWARPLGDSSCPGALGSEREQWFWESRPSLNFEIV